MVLGIEFIKVTEFDNEPVPVLTDILMLVDDPGGAPVSRRCTLASAFKSGQALGEIFITDGITEQSSITTTPTLMTAWNATEGSNGLAFNTAPAKASNQITIDKDGIYSIAFSVSAKDGNKKVFTWEIRVNGVVTGRRAQSKVGGGGEDNENISIHANLKLSDGDIVTIFIESDQAGGTSILMMQAQLTLFRIAEFDTVP